MSIVPRTTLSWHCLCRAFAYESQDIFSAVGLGGGDLLWRLFLVSETDEEYTRGAGKISIQKPACRRKCRSLLDL